MLLHSLILVIPTDVCQISIYLELNNAVINKKISAQSCPFSSLTADVLTLLSERGYQALDNNCEAWVHDRRKPSIGNKSTVI